MKIALILTACFVGLITAQNEDTYSNCIKLPQRPTCPSEEGCSKRISGCFRKIDGTCNNLKNPLLGSVNTTLLRVLRAEYDDHIDLPRGHHRSHKYNDYPTPHQVSKATFKDKSNSFDNSKGISTIFMTFGQFLDHDLSSSPHEKCNVTDCSAQRTKLYPCFPIKFDHGKDECTGFARSNPACKSNRHEARNQVNELTSFIDLSMVYGTSEKKARELRTLDGSGRLKIDKDGLLPIDHALTANKEECKNPAKCHLVGDKRGEENIALFSMHILWVREHNRIASRLRHINPHWNGEEIYQSTRKILGAMFQHIVYTEYLPFIIYPFERRQQETTTYNPHINPSIINSFNTAAFRYGHSLIPNSFSQMGPNFEKIHDEVKLQHAFENSTEIFKHGIAPTLIGLCGNKSDEVDGTFAHDILNKLFVFPGSKLHNDLTALNIQRARDHGIPTYGKWRTHCGFPAARSFYDLLYTPEETREAFSRIYKKVDDIDLFAVGITERHLGSKIVGPTFHCIIQQQFRNLRDGDRFFYTHKGVFSFEQLNSIKKISFSKVLCNNLKKDGMVSIQRRAFNAFNPQKDRRVVCESIPDIDLEPWREVQSHPTHPKPSPTQRRIPYGVRRPNRIRQRRPFFYRRFFGKRFYGRYYGHLRH